MFQRVSSLEMEMSTLSPTSRERMVSCSHSPALFEMDMTNLPWGMLVAPLASMTSSTVQETVVPIFSSWPSVLGARITSTPAWVFFVVAAKSSVKR